MQRGAMGDKWIGEIIYLFLCFWLAVLFLHSVLSPLFCLWCFLIVAGQLLLLRRLYGLRFYFRQMFLAFYLLFGVCNISFVIFTIFSYHFQPVTICNRFISLF